MGRRRKCYDNTVGPESEDKNQLCATYRLRNLLQLDNNPIVYRKFKRELYRVAEMFLDIKHSPRHQLNEWKVVEDELLSMFPDIFEGEGCETRLGLAMQMIAAYHYRRRFAYKRDQTQPHADELEYLPKYVPKKRGLVMSVSLSTRAAMKKKRAEVKKPKEEDIIYLSDNDDKVEFVEVELPQIMDVTNAQPGSVSIKMVSPPLAPISLPIVGPSTIPYPVPLKSQSTPPYAESSSQAQSKAKFSQNKSEDSFKSSGVNRVACFLDACFPSMAQFLNHFIDFGCTSEAYLAAVSTWPIDRISYFLSQVSVHGSDKEKMSEMDILVLQNHFISYFNKAQA